MNEESKQGKNKVTKNQDDSENNEINSNENKLSEKQREILSNIPPEATQEVQNILGVSIRQSPLPPEFWKNINSEHISSVIKNSEEENKRSFEYASTNRWFVMGIIAMCLIAFGLFTWFMIFMQKDDIFSSTIEKLLYFGAGLLAGKGLFRKND